MLGNCLDCSFCTAVCLLVESCRWREVYIERLVQFCEVVGHKLRSSIRDDFVRYAIVIVDLTYEGFDDISSVELLLEGYPPDE